MIEGKELANSRMYRLPWSTNDNPIGWVEVTDVCNLRCKGCYRLGKEGHKPLEKIKEEIRFLIKWRNCDNISLAGGEPVLHPRINEIIRFCSGQGLKVVMLTNGYALTEEVVTRLKKAGLTGFSFHIDITQYRPEFGKKEVASETELNELRLHYARMVKKVGGVFASFGITVTSGNLDEVPGFIQWAIDNQALVHGISLITFRGMPTSGKYEYADQQGRRIEIKNGTLGYTISAEEEDDIWISSKDVSKKILEYYPQYEANSYLGGTEDHTSMKWVIGNIIFNSRGKIFGGYGSRAMEAIQVGNHLLKGNYVAYSKKRVGKKIFWLSFVDKPTRKAFARFLKHGVANPVRLFYPVKGMAIAIIQAPDVLPDGRVNMCDDCPDMCVFDGKLVNSCRLDECRFFGGLLHLHVNGEYETVKEKGQVKKAGQLV